MRKLHCLLMGMLLSVGRGQFPSTSWVTTDVTIPTGLFISNFMIKVRLAGCGILTDGHVPFAGVRGSLRWKDV